MCPPGGGATRLDQTPRRHLRRSDLFEQAVAEVSRRRGELADHHRSELPSVESDLASTEAAIWRYLAAFESCTMPEAVCGPRARELANRAAQLRDRHSELTHLCSQTADTAPTQEALSGMRDHIHDAITDGSPDATKNLVQALVSEVRIIGEHAVQPVF